MGSQEDNEREIGKMTLERLAMRRQITEEAVRTAELRVEAAARLSELKEQEAQIRSAAQGIVLPPGLPSAPAPKKPDTMEIQANIIMTTLVTAFGAACVGGTTYLGSHNPVYGWWAAAIGAILFFCGAFWRAK